MNKNLIYIGVGAVVLYFMFSDKVNAQVKKFTGGPADDNDRPTGKTLADGSPEILYGAQGQKFQYPEPNWYIQNQIRTAVNNPEIQDILNHLNSGGQRGKPATREQAVEWLYNRALANAQVTGAGPKTYFDYGSFSFLKPATTDGGSGSGDEIGAVIGGAVGTILAPGVGTAVGANLGGSVGGLFNSQPA